MRARYHLPFRVVVFYVLLLVLSAGYRALADAPNWSAPGPYQVVSTDQVWRDDSRSRDVPVRVYAPVDAPGKRPVVLFSHGLGGTLKAGERWGRHWASWGIVSIHMQHAGSDFNAVRAATGTPEERMKSAMTADQLIARAIDVKFVVSEVVRRKSASDPVLGNIDTTEIGLSGHSFGAQTVLSASGQHFPGVSLSLAEPRIRAFVAFSPGVHSMEDIDRQFHDITRPFLTFTGSHDFVSLTGVTPEQRKIPFEHMAPGRKYLMWLDKATHESLSGQGQGGLVQALMALVEGRNTQVVDLEHIDTAVKAVSTAFWFAYLTPNSDLGRQASAWLASDAPKSICKPGDQWSVR